MFSAKYRFSIDSNKSTITLTPTLGLWIKAIAWSFAPLVVMLGLGAVFNAMESHDYEEHTLDLDES